MKAAGGRAGLSREALIEDLQKDVQAAYDRREAEIGEEVMRELERRVVLSVLDRKWREHLYEMDYLREGIYLRAYSQRDPLVEYQREGFDMFAAMMDGIKEESVGFLFNLQVEVEDDDDDEARAPTRTSVAPALDPTRRRSTSRRPRPTPTRPRPGRSTTLRRSGPRVSSEAEAAEPLLLRAQRGRRGRGAAAAAVDDDPFAGIGRNADCPCGSGKKFKKCHGAPGGASGYTTRVGG